MKCSQCATELSASSTVCPQCGTQIRTTDQPVPFSYLPAGTPPWPTTIPPHLPFIEDANPLSSASPLSAQSEKIQHTRFTRGILTLIAILILTPILGTLLTLGIVYANKRTATPTAAAKTTTQPQATPQTPPTLSTPTSFTNGKDTNLNMSYQYPSDWTTGPVDTSADPILPIHSPQQNGSSLVNLYIERLLELTAAKVTSSTNLNAQTLQSFAAQQGVHAMQDAPASDPQLTIGGTKWDRQDVTLLNGNNVKLHIMTLAVQRNKVYYNIIILTREEVFQDAMTKAIQPILNSLQFLT